MRVRKALLSVYDKTRLLDLARGLSSLGVGLIATGGTLKALQEAGLPATSVEDLTGFGEMLDGRVKTLHPAVHGAILARRSDREGGDAPYEPIDLVVVNLYPFEEGLSGARQFEGPLEELIDIGGPTMVRAAAKNWDCVGVVCDPADYGPILAELQAGDCKLSDGTRRKLAGKAFRRTSRYDAAIADWMEGPAEAAAGEEASLPADLTMAYRKALDLRYGENPHQAAALYLPAGDGGEPGVARAEVLQGKPLSYNNLVDADATLSLVAEIAAGADGVACAVIKHLSPCGAAVGEGADEALEAALATDPVSAFGGIIGLSEDLDQEAAERIAGGFYEIVLAPGFTEGALEVLAAKKNLRLLRVALPDPSGRDTRLRGILGGLLVQEADNVDLREEEVRVVTAREPDPEQWRALRLAWRVCKYVRSNAVVFGSRNRILGIGGGEPSRVSAARIGIGNAREFGHDLAGCAVASDAFFPFRDGVDLVAEAGASCIIQPGGSIRDEETVAAADEHGVAMVFTAIRHFRH